MTGLVARWLDRAVSWKGKRRYLQYLETYGGMESWTAETLRNWQSERLCALMTHACETVPYWREQLAVLGAQPGDLADRAQLAQLPLMTKSLINELGDALLSSAAPDARMRRRSTGGSTGQNVYFALDIDTHDRRRAAGRLTEIWDDVYPGTRLATIWGASLETRPSLASRAYDRLTGRLFLSAYGVDDEALAAHYEKLAAFRPQVVASYPSILLNLARRLGKKRCRDLGVRIVYTSAEALFEPVREELEDLFGAAVRNRYASREFGMIASDCPSGSGLHTMDMRMIVECEGTPDQPGELLVTDLDNYTMPMIRYPIGDLGVSASGPCPCGRPWSRLDRVEGRSLDVVVTPEGRAFGGTFFTLQLRPFDRSIREYQVIQDRADRLQIKVVPGESFADSRAQVLERIERAMGPSMTVNLVEVDSIDRLASGKRRFVVSLIDAPQAPPRVE